MNQKMKVYERYIKRLLDIILSGCALVVLSPIFLILALLVRIKLGSPVLFKQKRPGLNSEIFEMYKFRSMTNQTDEDGNLLPDKMRLTSFGKKLRSTSLDELPELINIFIGDMSIVGPRPLAVSYIEYYNDFEKQRHNVRPGLTGLAQVNGRNAISWREKFTYDIEYVNNVSLINDVKIVLKTIIKVVKREGVVAEGAAAVENFSTYRDRELRNMENEDKSK